MNEFSTGAKVLAACFMSGLVLCCLKLAHVIDWSWIVVTAPLWGPFALLFAALCALAVLMLTAKALKRLNEFIKNL